MKHLKQVHQDESFQAIVDYVKSASGYGVQADTVKVTLVQSTDGKVLTISKESLKSVLKRKDDNGQPFLQINFEDGNKILVTENLIGFRPEEIPELDMRRIPKVVTTPDLRSIFDAIQEALHSQEEAQSELEILRRIFESVITGGEAIGFDLASEKEWLRRIPTQVFPASA